MTELRHMEFKAFTDAMPDVVAALRTMSHASARGMDKGLIELTKVRASQLNGCAFCLQLHLNWARKAGVPQAKLDRVAAWREAPGFSDEERAALAWTEVLTDPSRRAEDGEARQALAVAFPREQVLQLTVAVAAVNAWNRIAGPLGFPPPPAE